MIDNVGPHWASSTLKTLNPLAMLFKNRLNIL